MTTQETKALLIEAYVGEVKAQMVYDKVFKSMSSKEKGNIQNYLIVVFFGGQRALFNSLESQYKTNKEKLSADNLLEMQVFYRTAMALSRRKAKEVESVDAVLEMVSEFGEQENKEVKQQTATANDVSKEEKKEKRERKPKGKKIYTKEDATKLLEKVIEIVDDRPDIKNILLDAITKLKLTVTTTEFSQFGANVVSSNNEEEDSWDW